MNIFKKIVSAVSAAVLAVTALTSVYSPSVSAEGYEPQSITQEYSAESELADIYASSSKAGFTLMVYMIGSNLESGGALATDDIEEICDGYSGKNVNIIIQTGGSVRWFYDGISAKKCQRFKVESYGLELVDDSIGMQNMSSPSTLSSFIRYCKKYYPASRYGLVLWDHGGGTVGGFGMDQIYSYESMSLEDYYAALKKGGVRFDFVGFDACLMATLETAFLTSGYSSYLFASEDSVSGIGWYYTDWIKSLCNDPKLSTSKLGKKIVDSTMKESASQGSYINSDISVINLSRIKKYVIPALNTFSQKSISLLKSKQYHIIAKNRAGLTIYDSFTELVDIADYASCFSDNSVISKSAEALKTAVKKAVIYRRTTGTPVGSGGLSMAFPFDDLENLDTVINIYDAAGVKTPYTEFLSYFANIMAGGQRYYLGASKAPDYSDCGWYDKSKFYTKSYYAKFYLDDDDMKVRKINGHWVCPISEDKSATISKYELCMYYLNENAGYAVDFGSDNIYDFDSKGRLIVEYNETWVSLNGTPIPCYYLETTTDDGYTKHVSYTYGEYNGQFARIYLMWDNDEYTYPDKGTIMAWSPLDDQGRASRLISAEKGDTFKIYYDVYDEDINYQDSVLADEYVYTVGKTRVTYDDVSYLGMTVIYYKITDIFNNVHFTENIYYYAE